METRKPIIQSLLDTDVYKFTMGQPVFYHFPDAKVRYAFKNRTKGIALAKIIKEEDLRRELDNVRRLKLNTSEMRYLRGTNIGTEPMFRHEYTHFLENQMHLPPYELKYGGDNFNLEFEGDWAHAIYWEIPALAIINELYYRVLMADKSKLEREAIYATGIVRLAEKIRILKEYLEIILIDFGTRRRHSFDWQYSVDETLKDEFPDPSDRNRLNRFRGTSNVWMAMRHGLMPMGTSAHEMFMILAGIRDKSDEDVRNSYKEVTDLWYKFYGPELSIALTDTYGSQYHFRTMTREEARNWKGLRQDSGDPIWFGETAIKFYQGHGVDSREKMIIFSDGLEIETILKIHHHFKGRIKTSFGWGTNLTNDLGIPALSMVIKPVMANGRGLVKLSDNPAKAIGTPEDIARYKRIFGYEEKDYIECKY